MSEAPDPVEPGDVERNLDSIRVYLSLERLGELVAAVAAKFADMRGVEAPDYAGDEGRELARYGWNYVCHMSDRIEFEASVAADLAKLETSDADGTE